MAERELGWKAERGLAEMMRDAWRWQQMNPGVWVACLCPPTRNAHEGLGVWLCGVM